MDEANDLLAALRHTFRDAAVGGPATPSRRSQNLESMLAAAEGPRGAGLAAVREQRQRLETARQLLETHLGGVSLGGTAAALVTRLRRLYDDNGEGLDALEAAVERGDPPGVSVAASRLRAITDQMFECQAAWQAELRLMEQEQAGMVVVPDAYVSLYNACEQLARNEIDIDRWLAVLEPIEQQVQASRDQMERSLGSFASQLADDPYCAGLVGQVRSGMVESLSALARMRNFVSSRELTDLNQGWSDLAAATVRVQKAMHSMSAGQAGRGDVVILDDD